MSRLPQVFQSLKFPVIASPLFIISNPKLLIAQCKAGVVGSMPALNARPAEQLEEWLIEITEALAAHNRDHPDQPPAPAATAIKPSAPFSIAFLANLLLITSCITMPP